MSTVDISLEIQDLLRSHSGGLKSFGIFVASLTLLGLIFRQWALPKPISGIPVMIPSVAIK